MQSAVQNAADAISCITLSQNLKLCEVVHLTCDFMACGASVHGQRNSPSPTQLKNGMQALRTCGAAPAMFMQCVSYRFACGKQGKCNLWAAHAAVLQEGRREQ
jgi:hypothetical protein